jgi:hypothetical protein
MLMGYTFHLVPPLDHVCVARSRYDCREFYRLVYGAFGLLGTTVMIHLVDLSLGM